MHHYECVALCKDISPQRNRFCARSLASCIPRSSEDRSSWMFFLQVVHGCPGGRLQFSGGGAKMAWSTMEKKLWTVCTWTKDRNQEWGLAVQAKTVQTFNTYDTIWDAMLTCNQKLTWVSLIYCTEPTTKKWKNRKREKWICSEVSVNSVGNPRWVSSEEEKEGYDGKKMQKRKVLSLEWKSKGVME